MVVEDREGATIGRHRMVVKVAADDRSQPFPLKGACAAERNRKPA